MLTVAVLARLLRTRSCLLTLLVGGLVDPLRFATELRLLLLLVAFGLKLAGRVILSNQIMLFYFVRIILTINIELLIIF